MTITITEQEYQELMRIKRNLHIEIEKYKTLLETVEQYYSTPHGNDFMITDDIKAKIDYLEGLFNE